MTLRERLADWISGGALTFHKNGWARSSALFSSAFDERENARDALLCIAAMETPKANATVRRMAKVARDAME